MFNFFKKYAPQEPEKCSKIIIEEKVVYDKLLEVAQNKLQDINHLANVVLKNYIKTLEKESKLNDDEKDFCSIDKFLYCTLEQNINVSLTHDDIGYEKKFILKDYSLSFPERHLSLTLERKNDIYRLTFRDINEIDYSLRDEHIKVWIKSKDNTWRFYLYFNIEKYKELEDSFKSEKYQSEKEVREYEKFRFNDPIKYHLGHRINYLGRLYKGEKEIRTKLGNQVFLVNSFDEKNSFRDSYTGEISFIAEEGMIGHLDYSIHYPTSELKDREPYLEIVDIPGETRINEGIRSEAQKYLVEIAQEKNIRKIVGELSPRDIEDHKDRLLHFYIKNGFIIDGHRITKQLP